MKLLFDESLSPKLLTLLYDLFSESESAFVTGLQAPEIGESWSTLPIAVSFWSRRIAISSVS